MKKSSLIILIVVIAGLLGGGYLLLRSDADTPTSEVTSGDSNPQTTTGSPLTNSSDVAATITYSNDGFSPSETTVKAGDTIAITNNSSSELQFASDPHPVHTNNSELNVDDVPKGETITFTVTKSGTFSYHNHVNPTDTGKIVVQ